MYSILWTQCGPIPSLHLTLRILHISNLHHIFYVYNQCHWYSFTLAIYVLSCAVDSTTYVVSHVRIYFSQQIINYTITILNPTMITHSSTIQYIKYYTLVTPIPPLQLQLIHIQTYIILQCRNHLRMHYDLFHFIRQ